VQVISSAPVVLQPANILVLLATYNGAQHLREQIDSILAQTGVEVNLVISDDASRDGTKELLCATWGNDHRVELLIQDQNSGSAGANFRRLFRRVDPKGFEFVALADQDDIWHPRKLLTAVEALRRSEAHGYSCAVLAFWKNGRRRVLRQQSRIRAADYLFEGAGQGCTFVIRCDLFVRVRQFCIDYPIESESMHFHDWMIYLLARTWGFTWHFDSKPWMSYRQHENNDIGSRGGFDSIERRLKLIRNDWYRKQISAALKIFELTQNKNQWSDKVIGIFKTNDSVKRRMFLSWFFLHSGRRKLGDRIVMAMLTLSGWI
jgi:rhamnosyltransferase